MVVAPFAAFDGGDLYRGYARRVSVERLGIADRIAWTYLASVLAGAAGGLLALIAYQIVNPLACPILDEDAADEALTCSVAAASGLTLIGFAVAFVGALFLLKLRHKLANWLAMVAGLLWLIVGLAGIGDWWWAILLALLPALAALASVRWSPRFLRHQVACLAFLACVAIGVLTWQFAGN